MKSTAFILFLLHVILIPDLKAQKGKVQIAVGTEIGTVHTLRGGFTYYSCSPRKVYYGIGESSHLLFKTGVHNFVVASNKMSPEVKSINRYMLPASLGFRQNIYRFYTEASLGTAGSLYNATFRTAREPYIKLDHNIYYGLEIGYQIKNFDIGISTNNTGRSPINMFYTGLKGAYRIQL